jgi:mycofactocin precursor
MADNAATLADTPAAELTDETAVTGPGGETAVTGPGGDLADDVLVEEVSIDGMCGVY